MPRSPVRLPNGDILLSDGSEVPWDREFVSAARIAEALEQQTKKFEKGLRRERDLRDPATPDHIKPRFSKGPDGKYRVLAWQLVDPLPDPRTHPEYYDWSILRPHGKRGRFVARK